jgi:hypothetical protein
VLTEIKNRGVTDARIVVCDGLKGEHASSCADMLVTDINIIGGEDPVIAAALGSWIGQFVWSTLIGLFKGCSEPLNSLSEALMDSPGPMSHFAFNYNVGAPPSGAGESGGGENWISNVFRKVFAV